MQPQKNIGFNLYLSNDLNHLFDFFLNEIDNEIRSNGSAVNPLTNKIPVIVQTEGMTKSLSINIAEKFGICCNFEFIFPKNFVLTVLKQLELIDEDTVKYFDKNNLALEIINIFQNRSIIDNNDFKEIEKYIRDDIKLGQFAFHMADIFDQYLTCRPEFIIEPQKITNPWQQNIFKRIISNNLKYKPIVSAIKEFIDIDFDKEQDKYYEILQELPGTFNLFAVSILPPVYIHFIKKLSKYKKINLYSINPSEEFWFDDLSEREKIRFLKELKETDDSSGLSLHFNNSNPILINNGKLIQDFYSLLYSTEPVPTDISKYNDYEYPESKTTVLSCIKNKIFKNENFFNETFPDQSIEIHSYHSKFREVEGLYNYILNLVQENSSNPNPIYLEDILVMCPDIDEYAPYIEAVFEGKKDVKKDIFYNISDNKMLEQDYAVKSIFVILDCLKENLTAKDFMSILELDPVKEKFKINQTEYEIIKEWVKDLNIRWGLTESFINLTVSNEENKINLEQKNGRLEVFNTFEYNAKRLLFGYFSGENEIIKVNFLNCLPYLGLTVSNGETLGKFLYVIDKITEFTNYIKKKRTLQDFNNFISSIINAFIEESCTQTNAFSEFQKEIERLNNYSIEVNFGTYLELLKNIKSKTKSASNFMKGGIIFCELVPLRNIPFKAICLLGLNDNTFPRKPSKLLFNEMELKPQKGDRSSRLNDRLLFLESILSAEDYLYISYIGKDLQNNKPVNPSIVVSELMDFIGLKPVEHPLHSFNPKYFTYENKNKLVNFSMEDFEVAGVLNENIYELKSNKIKLEFIIDVDQKLTEESLNIKEIISLDEIISFLKDPLKKFFNKQGIYFPKKEDELNEKEDISLDSLQEYNIRRKLIQNEADLEYLKYAGLLPHANIGKFYANIFEFEIKYIKNELKKINKDIELSNLKPVNIKKEGEDFVIEGKIEYVFNDSVIAIGFGNSEPKNKLDLAFKLFLCKTTNNFKELYFINSEKSQKIIFKEDILGDYEKFLYDIIKIYKKGLITPIILDEGLRDKKDDKQRGKSLKEVLEGKLGNKYIDKAYIKFFMEQFDFENAAGEYIDGLKLINDALFRLQTVY